jgi:YfiH family protein
MTSTFIESALLKKLKVPHGFFTKNAICSSALYGNLNSEDSKEDTIQNLGIAANALGFDCSQLTCLKQIHSNKVVQANNTIREVEGDAILTTKDLAAVLTADCVPILLYDKKNNTSVAVHAGWRGAYSGIIENSISKLQKSSETEIYAAIGPCIRQKNYEVNKEFYQMFLEQNVKNANYFIDSINKNHLMFDLPQYCYDKLQKYDIKNTDDLKMDTYADEENFFSNRRAYHKGEKDFGRNISLISPLK